MAFKSIIAITIFLLKIIQLDCIEISKYIHCQDVIGSLDMDNSISYASCSGDYRMTSCGAVTEGNATMKGSWDHATSTERCETTEIKSSSNFVRPYARWYNMFPCKCLKHKLIHIIYIKNIYSCNLTYYFSTNSSLQSRTSGWFPSTKSIKCESGEDLIGCTGYVRSAYDTGKEWFDGVYSGSIPLGDINSSKTFNTSNTCTAHPGTYTFCCLKPCIIYTFENC